MKYLIVMTACLCFLSVTTGAEVDIVADMDATVAEENPDWNDGGSQSVSVYSNPRMVGLFYFDIGPYMGAELSEAVLKLYVNSEYTYAGLFEIYRAAFSWDEETVTWNTAPPENFDIIDTFPLEDDYYIWLELEITEQVATWLDGSFENNGLYVSMVGRHTPATGTAFASSEDYGNHYPMLYLDYTLPGIEEDDVNLETMQVGLGSPARIEFTLPSEARVEVDVYDISGTHVEKVLSDQMSSGYHEIVWESGDLAGVFVIRIETGTVVKSRPLILLD